SWASRKIYVLIPNAINLSHKPHDSKRLSQLFAGAGHHGVAVSAAFDDAGFVAAGTVGVDRQAQARHVGGVIAQRVERVDEADSIGLDALPRGGVEHDQPDAIVDDQVDPQLLE